MLTLLYANFNHIPIVLLTKLTSFVVVSIDCVMIRFELEFDNLKFSPTIFSDVKSISVDHIEKGYQI